MDSKIKKLVDSMFAKNKVISSLYEPDGKLLGFSVGGYKVFAPNLAKRFTDAHEIPMIGLPTYFMIDISDSYIRLANKNEISQILQRI
ncbi:MAG: hypothetical protein LBI43_04785 [Streptococcaceae bacterium]|jgi:hypothetical protein|nr:hypothetical protein [Streptococcaceae bacterium]